MRTSPPLAPPAFEENGFWLVPARPWSSPASRHKSRLAGAGSLLLHTAIVSALVWLTPFSSPPAPSTKPRIINARLYTSPAPLEPPHHVRPESDKSSHSPALPPPPSGQPASKGGNSTLRTPTRRASPVAAQGDTSRQPLPQQPGVPVTPPADTAAGDSGSAIRSSLPVSSPPSVSKRSSVKRATANYFSAVHAQHRQQQAEEAAQAIQQRKTTRPLTDTRTVSQLRQLPDPAAPVSVNCTGNINKTLAFISHYTQGRVRCSEVTRHLQQTIDKRVQQHTGKR